MGDEVGNDPEVEKAGSTFAAECATAHWKSLTSAVTSGSPYSPVSGSDELDQKLYRSFRASFSPAAFDVGSFSRTTIHNEFTLPTWRALMLGWDGRIEVFNLITLLRTDCLMSYEDARAAGVEKLLLVPRVQFLMIEVARQRENCYDCLGAALHEAQLRQSANALRSALEFVLPSSRQASPSGAMAQAREAMDRLSKLAPPNEAALRATRAGRLLARVVKRSKIKDATDGRGSGERDGSTVSERLVATATATLTKWRAAVELRRAAAGGNAPSIGTIEYALRRIDGGGDDGASKSVEENGGIADADDDDTYMARGDTSLEKVASGARVLQSQGFVGFGEVLPESTALALADMLRRKSLAPLLARLCELKLTLDDTVEFEEVMNREGGRLDVSHRVRETIDEAGLHDAVINNPVLSGLARAVLGDDARLVRIGVVWSYGRPPRGAAMHQAWHRDSGSLFENEGNASVRSAAGALPCHCLNAFVNLCDVDASIGPTEFAPRSHRDDVAERMSRALVRRNATPAAASAGDESTSWTGANGSGSGDAVEDAPLHAETPAGVRTVAPTGRAGASVCFDYRVMHRGRANVRGRLRPVLYLTYSRRWYIERTFQPVSIFDARAPLLTTAHRQRTDAEDSDAVQLGGRRSVASPKAPPSATPAANDGDESRVSNEDFATLVALACSCSNGTTPRATATAARGSIAAPGGASGLASTVEAELPTAPYGHCHFTARYDLLLIEAAREGKFRSATRCASACAAFQASATSETFDLLISHLRAPELFERKQAALDAATDARRSHQSREDFSASLADYESACVLYGVLSSHLGPMLDRFGFPRGELGIVVLLAVAKAHGAPASTEAAFVDFFHGGSARFELIRAVSTSAAPAFAATDAPRLLIVAFSSLGSGGLARPEWRGTLREVGRFHDVLHVLDPAASWYQRSMDATSWEGASEYASELARRIDESGCTVALLIGDSMGASGALLCASASTRIARVVAFTPQTDIAAYAACQRDDFTANARKRFHEALLTAARESHASSIRVHYGRHCEEDVRQVAPLDGLAKHIHLTAHDFDDHTLSIHLRERGELGPIVAREIAATLALATSQKGTN